MTSPPAAKAACAELQMRRAELRLESRGSARKLIGYAARYGVVADIGPFRERISANAFAGSIGEGADILALLDHDPSHVLGRTRSKTLRLDDDDKGLAFEIAVPDTTAGRDALALAERGDLGGASIGFFVEEEERAHDEKWGDVRIVKRAQLIEISVVSAWPAYAETSVEARRGAFLDPGRHAGGSATAGAVSPRLDALRRYLQTIGGR